VFPFHFIFFFVILFFSLFFFYLSRCLTSCLPDKNRPPCSCLLFFSLSFNIPLSIFLAFLLPVVQPFSIPSPLHFHYFSQICPCCERICFSIPFLMLSHRFFFPLSSFSHLPFFSPFQPVSNYQSLFTPKVPASRGVTPLCSSSTAAPVSTEVVSGNPGSPSSRPPTPLLPSLL